MRTQVVECLLREISAAFDTLSNTISNLTGGSGSSKISSPDVSTYNDARGVVGDWSYNSTLNGGTYFKKVSVAPDAWISWLVSNS